MNTLTRAQFKALSYLAQATSENTVATVADSIGMTLIDTDALLKELTALGYIADALDRKSTRLNSSHP